MTFETELRAALERATPGPWEREGRGECWIAAPHTKLGSVPVVVPHVMQAVGDLDLIVLLRNSAEGIGAVLAAAREAKVALEDTLHRLGNSWTLYGVPIEEWARLKQEVADGIPTDRSRENSGGEYSWKLNWKAFQAGSDAYEKLAAELAQLDAGTGDTPTGGEA